jgi:hypothetical protein
MIEAMPQEYGVAGAALAVLAWVFWTLHSQSLDAIRAGDATRQEILDKLGGLHTDAVAREERLKGLERRMDDLRDDLREARRWGAPGSTLPRDGSPVPG